MFRRIIIGVITAAVLIGLPAASASAVTLTVTQAIEAQDKTIHASAAYKSLQDFKIKTAAEAKLAIPKYVALQKLLANAATAVSTAAATTATQKTGRKEWVTGVRTLARGIGFLVTELNDAVHGNKTATKAAAQKAITYIDAGNATGDKADALLGLAKGD